LKLKCYFAHPYIKKNTTDKYKIKKILEERGIEVIDPFIGEYKILREHGIKEYYETPNYKVARKFWIKDLSTIRECNMFVCWLPHPSIGTSAELMYALEWQKRIGHQDRDLPQEDKRPYLIQIIAAKKHPLFAYSLMYGNQQFESIKDFEVLRVLKW